ncbi:MAG TPA: MFS transporter [Azospirillaceae bacterium]|nr:MFS transporter [Azospirillaceae bacterium]
MSDKVHLSLRVIAVVGLVTGQQAPVGLLLVGLPAIYLAEGVDLKNLWVMAFASAPLWFKWAWAPLVDNYGFGRLGRRRSWLIPCTSIAAAGYILLSTIPPSAESLWPMVLLLMAINVALATQDIAVDAYTIEAFPAGREATAAASSTVGYFLGPLLGSAGLIGLYQAVGWQAALSGAAAVLLLATLPAMLLPDPHRTDGNRPRSLSPIRDAAVTLRAHLSHPVTWLVLGCVFAYAFAWAMPFRMESAYLKSLGISVGDIGLITGVFSAAGALAGTFMCERISARWGLQRAVVLSVLLAVPGMALYWGFGYMGGYGFAGYAAANLVASILLAPMYTAFLGLRFRWASRRHPGTDFTIQSSVTSLGQSAASASIALLASSMGWSAFLILCGLLLLGVTGAICLGQARLMALLARRDSERLAAEPAEEAADELPAGLPERSST